MIQTTIRINGMACSMCEAHVADTIRKAYPDAHRVSASHIKGIATFLREEEPSEELLRKAISETGYECISVNSEPYVKKGLFFKVR